MPKLTIDNLEVVVPQGTKVIEAAAKLNIMIPRFCYHPALGSVGACRVCAVTIQEGPVKGLQMSCMIDAQDDMVVSTTDKEAVDFRRHIIEWLMVNHPHDCPVCDEGGHCLLQDMTVSGGHGLRRFKGNKRTHNDQFLGPLIQHEMNRCIQCYRCSRFYQETAGSLDLGVMGIGSRVYFGRVADGNLESPFAGNLTDICPTGVFTDKPSRFKGRRWDFERREAICINCALGCHTVVSTRYRQVVLQEARQSAEINGHFICDRGRYGFFYSEDPKRPREATVDGRMTDGETAIQAAGKRLKKICGQYGPKSVAAAGSLRSSAQTLVNLDQLCRQNGWQGPAFWTERCTGEKVRAAVGSLSQETLWALGEIDTADHILVLGADPVNEAPMLAMHMRKAVKQGAKVTVLDPRPVQLPFDFQHHPVAPGNLLQLVVSILKQVVERIPEAQIPPLPGTEADIPDIDPETVGSIADQILDSRRLLVVCGTEICPETVIRLAADIAVWLQPHKDRTGAFYILPGPNACAAAFAGAPPRGFDQIIAGIENGEIKALILAESDPFALYPDKTRLEHALKRLDLLIVLDYLDSPGVNSAQIFIPVPTVYECGGIFINNEGRAQQILPVFGGGGFPLQPPDPAIIRHANSGRRSPEATSCLLGTALKTWRQGRQPHRRIYRPRNGCNGPLRLTRCWPR